MGEKNFIQKSKIDCRPLERAIDTFEEKDVPVTADEIIQASKNLKDSAPGLDGMKKCDLNKIAPEDMTIHAMVWLIGLMISCSVDVLQMYSKRNCCLYSKKKKERNPDGFKPITVGSLADYSTAC